MFKKHQQIFYVYTVSKIILNHLLTVAILISWNHLRHTEPTTEISKFMMVRLMTFLCDFCIGALGFKLRGKGSWFLSKVTIDLSPSKRRHRVLTKIWSIYKNRITCFTLDIFYAKGRICISCSNKKAERTYKWMHVCIMNIYIYTYYTYINIMYTRYIMYI